MKTTRLILGVALLVGVTTGTEAGERANVRGMGMARTFTASSRGLDAVGINPANLAMPDKGTVSLSLLPFGVHLGTELINYELYTTYFTGTGEGRSEPRQINHDDKARLLRFITADLPESRVDLDARLFGFAVRLQNAGTFALTVTDQIAATARIPRDYVEFVFNGNPPGSSYDFRGTRVMGSWTREYTLSFGAAIPPPAFLHTLAGGASVKMVHGFAYYGIEKFNASLVTGMDGRLSADVDFLSRYTSVDQFEKSFSLFPTPAGSGYGVDAGLNAMIVEGFHAGLAVTDIGRISWTHGTTESFADTAFVVDDPLDASQRDMIENALKGKKRDGAAFTSPLPTTIRLGVAMEMSKMFAGFGPDLLVALDYNQGLVASARSSTTPRFSMGVEYKPVAWLPLRSGVSVGGTDGVDGAFGFGLFFGAFEFEVASENVSALVRPGSFSRGSVAMGTRLRF